MTEERYNELKLAIFEKCEDGEITESEKDDLLEALNSVMESTAYNRKIDEYKKEVDKIKKKMAELDDLKNSKHISDNQKALIEKQYEKLNDKVKDINNKIINMNGSVGGASVSSLEAGKKAAAIYSKPTYSKKLDALNDIRIKGHLEDGSALKKHTKNRLGISNPEAEKEPGMYLKVQKALKESVMESFCEDEITSEQALNIMEAVDTILS